jgi:hypothetical protein
MGFVFCKFVAILLLLFLLLFCFDFGVAVDIITSSQFIKDPEAIVSARNIFKLGFFSPVNSTNRYVGIWYNDMPTVTTVWVANRNEPLNDSSGVLKIFQDGNLVVLNGQQEILWSSNVLAGVKDSRAQLTDEGNLVLLGKNNGNVIWESFQQPCNTLLPNMRLSANARTGESTVLTSWISPSDPSVGRFSVSMDPLRIPEVFVWNYKSPYWRSGPWNGQIFIGIPEMNSVYLDGFNLAKTADGAVSLSFTYVNQPNSNFVLRSDGKLIERAWKVENQDWFNIWNRPETECDIYGKCGAFGSCNAVNSPICSCLRGFVPKNPDEWNKGNWTSGCLRRTPLECTETQNIREVNPKDGFLKLEMIKVPDFSEWSSLYSELECRNECLSNCSCIAYSYYKGIGCMLWTRSLIDIQKFSVGGADLYLRLAYSELGNCFIFSLIFIKNNASYFLLLCFC